MPGNNESKELEQKGDLKERLSLEFYSCLCTSFGNDRDFSDELADELAEIAIEQLTTTQQALDSAVEALKKIKSLASERYDSREELDMILEETKAALAGIKGNNEIDICEQLAKEDL